ncbi:MAG: hypothetical protein ACRC8Y_13770 [Chroococcales cyanobacterium]
MTQQIYPIDSSSFSLTHLNQDHESYIKPLALIINPSTDITVVAGETFELRVTVTNQGHQGALINIYINENSGIVRHWCASPSENLALASNSSAEVVFRFDIPINANPETYSYSLVIDAPKHYPKDTPIHHEARLQVLPPVQSLVRVNDPTFTIAPATSATQPATLEPGQPFDLKVVVQNRSDRVDRFRLTCSDLPQEWCSTLYPEGVTELGLVRQRESLSLNPGAKGEILLRLRFPTNINAGNYSFSVALTSVNYPDLVLMDVVYLQVLPLYRLSAELQTVIGKVSQEPGWFRLSLFNSGNTLRKIAVTVQENSDQGICTYLLTPPGVILGAQTQTHIDLQVQPKRGWQRPWWGKGLPIQFYVELRDDYQLPIPERLEGNLIWEARPLWHLVLLILTVSGSIASLVFLLWWLFFRPPTSSQIFEFTSVAPVYEALAGDAIYLNWEIRHPQTLKAIKLTGFSTDSNLAVSPTVIYDFTQGIPRELQTNCTGETHLKCHNVRTDVQQSGNYIFEMEIFGQTPEILLDKKTTHTIRIEPLPLPRILEFSSTRPIYQEVIGDGENITPNTRIALNWKIANPNQLDQLKLIGRAEDGTVISPLQEYNFRNGIPTELSQHCSVQSELTCGEFPLFVSETGNHFFEITAVYQHQGETFSISEKTEAINIQPSPIRILYFNVNGNEALPKYILPTSAPNQITTFRLSWKITGGKKTKVELEPIGTVPLEGSVAYPVSPQAGIEQITLLVTGEGGQELRRTVTIEKVAPRVTPPPTPDVKIVPLFLPPLKIPPATNEPSPVPMDLPSTGSIPPEKPITAEIPIPAGNDSPSPPSSELSDPAPNPTAIPELIVAPASTLESIADPIGDFIRSPAPIHIPEGAPKE